MLACLVYLLKIMFLIMTPALPLGGNVEITRVSRTNYGTRWGSTLHFKNSYLMHTRKELVKVPVSKKGILSQFFPGKAR